jgi:orotidine-5'-phosphate decarboxylase
MLKVPADRGRVWTAFPLNFPAEILIFLKFRNFHIFMHTPGRFRDRFAAAIERSQTTVCVGLDPDPDRIPAFLGKGVGAAERFLTSIIEATADVVAAFKPNTAYFEAYGHEGWALLEQLRNVAGREVLWIVDAKRGDIEHTNEAYARALFDVLKADAITVQPYAGGAALEPFYRNPARGVFVLCATSNAGAEAVQEFGSFDMPLYLEVARQAGTWSPHDNIGLVMGTTKPMALEQVLKVAPDLPLLLPGGGTQGGGTTRVRQLLRQYKAFGGLFNFSRSVIYRSTGEDFAEAARAEILQLRATLT